MGPPDRAFSGATPLFWTREMLGLPKMANDLDGCKAFEAEVEVRLDDCDSLTSQHQLPHVRFRILAMGCLPIRFHRQSGVTVGAATLDRVEGLRRNGIHVQCKGCYKLWIQQEMTLLRKHKPRAFVRASIAARLKIGRCKHGSSPKNQKDRYRKT